MARAAWSGAITFAGFPINVKVFNLVKSKAGESFKQIAPNGHPVKQLLVDSDGEVVERADLSKGVEVAKGQFKVLPPEAVEMIQSAEKSVTLDPLRFSPLESVPLHLATGQFRVMPDEKVPGSEQPVGILWNGLFASKKALVTTWTPRAGSTDKLLVIHADEYGLNANTLPFKAELQDVPEWKPEVNDEAAGVFEQFVEHTDTYEILDFNHGAFESTYAKRRADAVQAALKGETIAVPEVAAAKAATPDLMAAMQASLGAKKPKAKKAPAKEKVAA